MFNCNYDTPCVWYKHTYFFTHTVYNPQYSFLSSLILIAPWKAQQESLCVPLCSLNLLLTGWGMHIDAIPVCVTDAPDGLTGQRDKAFSSSKAMQNSFCNTWNTLFKTYISSPLTLRAKKCVCKLNYSSDHGLIRYLIFSHSCSYNVYIFTVFSRL